MGYFDVLAASVLFGITPALSALLQRNGWSSNSIILNNEIFGALYLFCLIRLRGLSLRAKWRAVLAAAGIGGAAFWGTNMLLQLSYVYLPNPGIATVFHFTYPIFVMLMMAALFRERITPVKSVCMLLAMCGMLLLSDVSGGVGEYRLFFLGAAVATASGITYAIYIIATGKSAARVLPSSVLTFYVLVGGAACNLVYTIISARRFQISLEGWNAVYALITPVCSFLALTLIAEGIHRIGPTRAAAINMLEPVAALLISALVFRDGSLTPRTVFGSVLILAGTGVISVLKEPPRKKRTNPQNQSKRRNENELSGTL